MGVLQARYYSGGGFLNSRLGSNPSYIWHSLWSAHGLIEQWFRWRIGNGERMNIWNDPWLSGLGDRRNRRRTIYTNYTTVSDLIDHHTSTWKRDVLTSHIMRDCWFMKRLCDAQGIRLVSADYDAQWGECTRNRVVHDNVVLSIPATLSFIQAFFNQHVELGAVINSAPRKTSTSPHRDVADAFVAEALSCLQVVRFAKDLGFRRIVMKGDSLTVIKKLCRPRLDKSRISPVIHDIKELSKCFEEIVFTFVGLEANHVAHILASGERNIASYNAGLKKLP
ncbi:hypothetical protein F3Y22_tig00110328pilonHSYRG00885 [Hibiscus syriacus]|uniref:RNase H type-1 domain-containing protein n=1 Tax=Hibiscus syriacus TaxID=106335 RepID=A0A6A3B3M2_HIBSY|nr:hypothetical protein F3Y22_tig00110328pilonHSYRG00885 [Hibiscus syriacus]